MSKYAKLLVALGGAVAGGAILAADGWSLVDTFAFLGSLITAAGVGLVPNSE